MEIKLLIAGILTGILVSVPVGPMGIFVVRKTVNQGWWAGFRSGLGLTTADVIFATIATIGLSVVIAFIREKELMFKLIGGVVVLLLGINIFLTSPRKLFRNRRRQRNQDFFRDYLSVVMLTLSNPLSILLYISIFATVKISGQSGFFSGPVLLVLGVGTGSAGSWLILTMVLSHFRRKLRFQNVFWFNKFAGALIMVFGLVVLGSPLLGI